MRKIGLRALLVLAVLATASCASQPAAPATSKSAAPASSPASSSSAPASSSSAPASSPAAAAPTVAPTPPPTVKLKVATLRIIADAGMYFAQEKGYFKEQGLDVEFTDFATAADVIAPLSTGQLDIGVGAVTAGLFNAIARGIDITMVADKAATTPDPKNGFNSSLALAVPKEYIQNGTLKDFADLKGKTIAISAEGNASHILLDHALQKGGLTLKDVTVKRLSFPDLNPALSNKAIDGAIHIEPLLTLGESQGFLARWKRAEDIYPGQQVGVIMYGPRVKEIGQNVGNRFMVAYVKGLRDYNDAFGPKKKNRAEMVSILTKYTSVKDAALYDKMGWDYMNPDGYVNMKTLETDTEWYVTNGFVQTKPDLKKAVDNSFADYAVKQLGKYQP